MSHVFPQGHLLKFKWCSFNLKRLCWLSESTTHYTHNFCVLPTSSLGLGCPPPSAYTPPSLKNSISPSRPSPYVIPPGKSCMFSCSPALFLAALCSCRNGLHLSENPYGICYSQTSLGILQVPFKKCITSC